MSDWRINNGDFEEDDVWSVMKTHDDHSNHNMRSTSKDYMDYPYSSSSSSWHYPTTPRMIPRANHNHTTSSSLVGHDEVNKIPHQSSAPVNIPDWSKIYGKNTNGKVKIMDDESSSSWVDVDQNHVHGGYGYNGGEYHYGVGDYGYNNNNGDDDDDDDIHYGGVIPPHEWIAKRLARTQISSFSVCEGAGRTLKGRELSKLRNAILTKTGFLE